ncbi:MULTISPECIES: aromatic acid exporter family protein [unclassified Solibacillus]|uniref:aromatic acid exporter family protein n=1 Tax=unclassified Solibacillus TaxID=2637870 RepID=UPI0030FA5162
MKKFSIGYRTLKTALGASIAIAIAQYFDLQFFTAAGILTILCIQPTKRKSLHAVYTRVVSTLVGMTYAFIFFEIFGYSPIVLGIVLLLFIPTIVSLRVVEGFISSSVIMMHIFLTADFTTDLLLNELGLMAIGFGVGVVINMYMPDIQHGLFYNREKIESLLKKILAEIAVYLRNGDTLWDGKEIIEAAKVIEAGKALAFKDVENHLTRKENIYYVYFDMREKQLEIIERVLPKITTLPVMTEQAPLVAAFIEDLSEHVHSGNTASHFLEKLDKVKEEFAKMPLPNDHETFIAMASLYQFIEEMDAYLVIKQSFKGMK